jgi:hypothetical protein
MILMFFPLKSFSDDEISTNNSKLIFSTNIIFLPFTNKIFNKWKNLMNKEIFLETSNMKMYLFVRNYFNRKGERIS